MPCPGQSAKIAPNRGMKFYAFGTYSAGKLVNGSTSHEFTMCEWCVENGCADPIAQSQYGAMMHEVFDCEDTEKKCKNPTFNCDCPNIHPHAQLYFCRHCLSNKKGNDTTINYLGGWGSKHICDKCGDAATKLAKYCARCAVDLDICICGRSHLFVDIPLSDKPIGKDQRLIVEKYFRLDFGRNEWGSDKIGVRGVRTQRYLSKKEVAALPSEKVSCLAGCGRRDAPDTPYVILMSNIMMEVEKQAANVDFGPPHHDSWLKHNNRDKPYFHTYLRRLPFGSRDETRLVTSVILRMADYYPRMLNLLSVFDKEEYEVIDDMLIEWLTQPNHMRHNRKIQRYIITSSQELINEVLYGCIAVGDVKGFYRIVEQKRDPTVTLPEGIYGRLPGEFARKLAMLKCKEGSFERVKELCSLIASNNATNFNPTEISREALIERMKNPKNTMSWRDATRKYVQTAESVEFDYSDLYDSVYSMSVFDVVFKVLVKQEDFDMVTAVKAVVDGSVSLQVRKGTINESLRDMLDMIIRNDLKSFVQRSGTSDAMQNEERSIECPPKLLKCLEIYKRIIGSFPDHLSDFWATGFVPITMLQYLMSIGHVPGDYMIMSVARSYKSARRLPWGKVLDPQQQLREIKLANSREDSLILWWTVFMLVEIVDAPEERELLKKLSRKYDFYNGEGNEVYVTTKNDGITNEVRDLITKVDIISMSL